MKLDSHSFFMAMKLPMDVSTGESMVSMIGRRMLYVENYRSILVFTDRYLKIQGKSGRVVIRGRRLTIPYYTDEQLKVQGLIEAVELED